MQARDAVLGPFGLQRGRLALAVGLVALLALPALASAAPLTSVDLSTYVRTGRFDLPEPTRTPAPLGSLLAQEASSVTYDPDTNSLFVVGDGGTSVVQVSKTGALIDSMTLGRDALGEPLFGDTEGITYVGGGRFVIVEERVRQVDLFTYNPGSTLARADVQSVKLGTTIGNIGIEGITDDPLTGDFIAVKETQPEGIFQTGIDFAAGTATNGSPTTDNSTNLFDPALAGLNDFSDVFALSNLSGLTGPDAGHLLVISQESGKVVNIDRLGNVSSTLTIHGDLGNPLSVPDQTDEGVTMDDDGNLYVVNEQGGGDVNHPQLWSYAPSTAPNTPPTAVTLFNKVNAIAENTPTPTPIKVADVNVTDDGLGTNNLTVTGPDAASFQVDDTGLYVKAGTVLDFETKPSYTVSVAVDDPVSTTNPDATSAPFTLNLIDLPDGAPATPPLIVSEASPWSSGNSPYAADWFELTNTGAAPVDLTGFKMDDNSNAFGSAVALSGVTSIPGGQSAIFAEVGGSATAASVTAAFTSAWFGSSVPKGFQIGTYSGSGVGLSTSGDAVNIFDAVGSRVTGISFGASTTFFTFDNAAGVGSEALPLPAVSHLSVAGVNGAYLSGVGETGSPGTILPDTTRPTVTYGGNAGAYTVDQQVNITCTAADEPRGSGIASTTCADISGAAADFGLGAHPFSATATDKAGNVGGASGSFTVTVTTTSLCNLTRQYVVGSETYQAMKANQRAAVDKRVDTLCSDALAPIAPGITAMKRNALISRYKDGVAGLTTDGLLTQAQSAKLGGFASAL